MMMLVLYILTTALLTYGVAMQVVVPFVNDRPLFPLFRRKAFKQLRDAEQDLRQAQRTLAAAEMKKNAAEVQKQAATVEVETAEIEMRTNELREGLLDGWIDDKRALCAGPDSPDSPGDGVPLPNGKDTTH